MREGRLPRHLGLRRGGAAPARRLARTARAGHHPARPPARARPQRPAAAGRRGRPRARDRAARSRDVNDPEALAARSARRGPDAVVVCAFGQLIREPLLSELRMLNVHPSLLPRWRGAAPIERAIMAGDARTGVSVMRVAAGLDAGPVALREEVPIGPDEDYGALSRSGSPRSAGSCSSGRSTCGPRAPAFNEQDEDGATYAEKIDPAERRLDPARPAVELARVGARADPAHRRLPGARRRRAARGAARPARSTSSVRARRGARRVGRLLLGCGAGALRLEVVQPPGGKPMGADAYLRGHRCRGCERGRPRARALAFEVIRRDLRGRRLHRARLPRGGRSAGLGRRERAQAQRLAYGAVQRRGTLDAAIERLAGRAARRSTRRCSPACGSASTSCCSPTAPRPCRGRPGGRAGQAGRRRPRGGLVNAVLRRAAREREELARAAGRRLDPRGGGGRPLGAALAGRDVVARAGAGAARVRCSRACNEPAEVRDAA